MRKRVCIVCRGVGGVALHVNYTTTHAHRLLLFSLDTLTYTNRSIYQVGTTGRQKINGTGV